MDPRGGPRPSPYSILTLDASTSNPVRPSQRLSPEAGGYIETITRGALKPSTNYASGTAQQFAGSSQQYAPSKATSAGFEFQKYKKNVDSYDIHDRDPPPYDEHDLHEIHPAEARPKVGHAVVELHEAGPFTDEHQPEAIQTMVKMVTMLNFMKVELGDHKTLRSKEQWRAAAAEFIGTMLFVYLGCGSVIASGMFVLLYITLPKNLTGGSVKRFNVI
uniref:Uncharacterized protein n=1 Tax=Physcomitrium patens TaxID=3218 RepID=A0A7I4EFH5_PHYPA